MLDLVFQPFSKHKRCDMRISLIGSGRVATHLAQVLTHAHQIVQVYSPQLAHAQLLADLVSAQAISSYDELDATVDLVVIAVSDQAIAHVIADISALLSEVLIVHTSGSTDLAVLSEKHARAGVFYPLQTFSFGQQIDWQNTPIFVEATTQNDVTLLMHLANSLSNRVYHYSSSQRLSLHLAAVFACNFTNYCYDMAQQIVDAEQVDFSLLHPLMLATAQKAILNAPCKVQTGPAVRRDENILNMHLQLLGQAGRTDLAKIYQLLSVGIQNSQSD